MANTTAIKNLATPSPAEKTAQSTSLSLIHISEPTRRYAISYAVFSAGDGVAKFFMAVVFATTRSPVVGVCYPSPRVGPSGAVSVAVRR